MWYMALGKPTGVVFYHSVHGTPGFPAFRSDFVASSSTGKIIPRVIGPHEGTDTWVFVEGGSTEEGKGLE